MKDTILYFGKVFAKIFCVGLCLAGAGVHAHDLKNLLYPNE